MMTIVLICPHRRRIMGKKLQLIIFLLPSIAMPLSFIVMIFMFFVVGAASSNGGLLQGLRTDNITTTGKVWSNNTIGRTVSTASVADGVVYLAEFSGGTSPRTIHQHRGLHNCHIRPRRCSGPCNVLPDVLGVFTF